MNAIVEIDKSGRIVIPKKMRDAMGLRAGVRLKLQSNGDGISLQQDLSEAHLEVRHGLLVAVGGPTRTVEDVNRLIEEERDGRLRFDVKLSDEP
jgi:AbrB family looped-hinge helix DNA binding protein